MARIGEKEQRSAEGNETERKRAKDGDGKRDALTERGNKREKASSCGLAELTVNLCRFIFSGACCSLKGGQIHMPLPGLLLGSARGAEDGISGLMGRDGGFPQVTGVTPSGRGRRASQRSPLSFPLSGLQLHVPWWSIPAYQLAILIRNTPSINRGVSF